MGINVQDVGARVWSPKVHLRPESATLADRFAPWPITLPWPICDAPRLNSRHLNSPNGDVRTCHFPVSPFLPSRVGDTGVFSPQPPRGGAQTGCSRFMGCIQPKLVASCAWPRRIGGRWTHSKGPFPFVSPFFPSHPSSQCLRALPKALCLRGQWTLGLTGSPPSPKTPHTSSSGTLFVWPSLVDSGPAIPGTERPHTLH